MSQLTLRLPDGLVRDVKAAAAASGQSVNGWIHSVLDAAVNPDLATDEAERLRERLRRAGVLLEPKKRDVRRPGAAELARARRAAGRGKPLSEYVSEGRGAR